MGLIAWPVYCLKIVVLLGIAVLIAVLDPGFDDDENSIKAICNFARDSFSGVYPGGRHYLSAEETSLDAVSISVWLIVLGILAMALFRVLFGRRQE